MELVNHSAVCAELFVTDAGRTDETHGGEGEERLGAPRDAASDAVGGVDGGDEPGGEHADDGAEREIDEDLARAD